MGDSVTARRSSHDKVVVVSPGPGPRQPNKLHYHERINKIRDNIRYSCKRNLEKLEDLQSHFYIQEILLHYLINPQ